MEKFDIVIIGTGPAGLAAAKILGEEGKKVIILEKNEKIGPKICAGGLTPKGFEIGIPISLAEKIFYSVRVHSFGKTIEVKNDKPIIATISRETLGQWQAQQIKDNVEIRLNSKVVQIKDNSVLLKDGQEIEFNYLIGADGSLSLVRKYLNLPTKKVGITMQYTIPSVFNNLEIFFDKNLFGSHYAWIFPHGKYATIGCGSDLTFKNIAKLSKNFHQWLREQKIEVGQAKLESFPINFDYQGFNFGNKFLIGDAAGFASSLTGEGIYFAIISGQEVAKKILNPNYSSPNFKKNFRKKIIQEKVGKLFMFQVLRNKRLTQFSLKRFF